MIMRSKFFQSGALFALMLSTVEASVVYVSDAGTGTVSAIVRDDLTGSWSSPVIALSGLSGPKGIAVDIDGNIYVANTGMDEILKYDITAQTLSTFATLPGVSWIAVDLLGSVFAVSSNTLSRFDTPGSASASMALNAPDAVTVGEDGYVYVANTNADQDVGLEILRIDRYLTTSTSYLSASASLNAPGGLAFRGTDLYVSNWFPVDPNPLTVDRFDANGDPMTSWSDPSLDFSNGLAFSLFGDLLLASGSNVVRFDTNGVLQETFAFINPQGVASAGAVPEPGTYAMIGIGLIMLSFIGRRKPEAQALNTPPAGNRCTGAPSRSKMTAN